MEENKPHTSYITFPIFQYHFKAYLDGPASQLVDLCLNTSTTNSSMYHWILTVFILEYTSHVLEDRMLYTCLTFQQLELLNTLTWRKIAGRYFQNQEFTMISPSALNPEESLESPNPTSHSPTPFPSLSKFSHGQWNQATTHNHIKNSGCYHEFLHSTANSVAKLALLSYGLLFGQIMSEPFKASECSFHYCRFGALPKKFRFIF